MDLKTYFFSLSNEDREVFAKKCDTSSGHLRNCAYGYKFPSPDLAVLIEKHSKRAVTRQEMFPNTFKKTWPELKAA
jgi:hypothetical protein